MAALGQVDGGLISSLGAGLEKIFGRSINTLKTLDIPAKYYDKKQGQYNASGLLSELKKIHLKKGEKILGITEVDLFAQGLNFVFGQAELGGPASIISLARLRQEFYGSPTNPELLLERTIKEAVHELGHTFGLGHCPDPGCVMHFSNNLHDTDIKSNAFCPNCQPKMIA